ncbi:MAG: RsmD family RNA methyltransferase [Acidobacteriia bacterium]|jgi:23S rRNA (uracil1939-C5)-methyltransferase|nr:RsmD family RNA methyltransferase [Terriglobia bacterium]
MSSQAERAQSVGRVVQFEHFDATGMAVGTLPGREGRTVLAYGVLPGERARVRVVRRRRGVLLAEPEELLIVSPERVPPREAHYLSCSPWQVLAYPAQVTAKQHILEELFSRAVGRQIQVDAFHPSAHGFGYRNKLEFSFAAQEGTLRLAFFVRFGPSRKVALENGCALGTEAMNAAAEEVMALLNRARVPVAMLKSLVVRQSRTSGDVVTVLFVRGEEFPLKEFPLTRSAGFVLAASHPESPASVLGKILHQQGCVELEEDLAGLRIAYPFDAFFQNHVELFALALDRIRSYVEPVERIVELYAGVGVIGLALCDRARSVLAVESTASAVLYAQRNAQRLAARQYEIVPGTAERVGVELLRSADVLLLDPPRTGLHPKLLNKILDARPPRILYLSCNPIQQARELALLREVYELVALEGFDFYPQTPHIEALLVLERKAEAAAA